MESLAVRLNVFQGLRSSDGHTSHQVSLGMNMWSGFPELQCRIACINLSFFGVESFHADMAVPKKKKKKIT